jgi:Nuclease-related domain
VTIDWDQQGTAIVAILVALLLAAALSALAVLGWRRWQLRRAQRRRLAKILAVALEHTRHVLVADGNGGQLYVDWLLLTSRGLLLLDVREVSGHVFGSEHMAEWTVMRGALRNTFPNPLPPLLDRMAVLSRLVPELAVEGRIVFTENARFPKGVPVRCLGIDSLAAEFPVVEAGAAASLSRSMLPHWQRLLSQMTPDTSSPRPL